MVCIRMGRGTEFTRTNRPSEKLLLRYNLPGLVGKSCSGIFHTFSNFDCLEHIVVENGEYNHRTSEPQNF